MSCARTAEGVVSSSGNQVGSRGASMRMGVREEVGGAWRRSPVRHKEEGASAERVVEVLLGMVSGAVNERVASVPGPEGAVGVAVRGTREF